MFAGPIRFRARATGIDGSARDFFDFVGASAFSRAQKVAYSDLVVAMKGDGSWDKLDGIYLWRTKVSQAAANANLKEPGAFTCTTPAGAAGGLTAAVWTNNVGYSTLSTDENYVDTNYQPSTAGRRMTQDGAHLLLKLGATGVQYANMVVGWDDGTRRLRLNPNNASDQVQYQVNQNGTSGNVASGGSNGHFAIGRSNSTTIIIRKDLTSLHTNSATASNGLPQGTIKLGRTANANFQTVTQAEMLMFGLNLTLGNQTTIKNAVDAFFTAMDAT